MLTVGLALGLTRPALAQHDVARHAAFGAWAGASFFAPGSNFLGGGILGGENDRDLFLVGVRGEWLLASTQHIALAATMDAIPLAIVTRNPYYTDRVVASGITRGGSRIDILEQTGRGPVYGFGAAPLGLELFGPRIRAVRPYLASAAGVLWFTRNTPEPEARRLNATFEFGAGLRIASGEHRALILGWKFHHISNAFTAPYNPGLDGNVIYLGVQRR